MNRVGEMSYTDNQGPGNGTCALRHLAPGAFQGHPGGNRWYDLTDAIGPRPAEPKSNSRIPTEAARIPQLPPPAVLFPDKKWASRTAVLPAINPRENLGLSLDSSS